MRILTIKKLLHRNEGFEQRRGKRNNPLFGPQQNRWEPVVMERNSDIYGREEYTSSQNRDDNEQNSQSDFETQNNQHQNPG